MKVFKLDINTLDVIETYNNLSEAGRSVGTSGSRIRQACAFAHRGDTAKGYRWFAVNEYDNKSYYSYAKNSNNENITLYELKNILVEKNKIACSDPTMILKITFEEAAKLRRFLRQNIEKLRDGDNDNCDKACIEQLSSIVRKINNVIDKI